MWLPTSRQCSTEGPGCQRLQLLCLTPPGDPAWYRLIEVLQELPHAPPAIQNLLYKAIPTLQPDSQLEECSMPADSVLRPSQLCPLQAAGIDSCKVPGVQGPPPQGSRADAWPQPPQ